MSELKPKWQAVLSVQQGRDTIAVYGRFPRVELPDDISIVWASPVSTMAGSPVLVKFPLIYDADEVVRVLFDALVEQGFDPDKIGVINAQHPRSAGCPNRLPPAVLLTDKPMKL